VRENIAITEKEEKMKNKENERLGLGKSFYILLAIGMVLLVLGYFIMSTNEITISAIILFVAYVITIPVALLWHKKPKE